MNLKSILLKKILMDDELKYSLTSDPWKLTTYNKRVQKVPPSKRVQLSIF